MKYPHRCNICDKSFATEHGLKIHHFRKHVIKKKKGRPLGSKNGVKKPKNAWSSKEFSALDSLKSSLTLAYCPCCGVDLRKIAIALSL